MLHICMCYLTTVCFYGSGQKCSCHIIWETFLWIFINYFYILFNKWLIYKHLSLNLKTIIDDSLMITMIMIMMNNIDMLDFVKCYVVHPYYWKSFKILVTDKTKIIFLLLGFELTLSRWWACTTKNALCKNHDKERITQVLFVKYKRNPFITFDFYSALGLSRCFKCVINQVYFKMFIPNCHDLLSLFSSKEDMW